MRKTGVLKLPIYDVPETDLFKLQDWNEGNQNIENKIKELGLSKVDWIVSKNSVDLLENLNQGESHFLTKEVFVINNNINYSGSLELIGNNAEVDFSNTSTRGVIITNGKYVRVKDIIFKGKNIERLLDISSVTNTVVFENCVFEDIGRNAVVVDNAEKVIVKNCDFKNIRGNAFTVKNAKNVIFVDNIAENIGTVTGYREGSIIYAHNCENVTIRGTKGKNILDSAIYINHCNGGKAIINGNTIEDCYKEAIKNQNNGSKTIITGNIVNKCLGNAIIAHYSASDVIIKDNIILDSCLKIRDNITLNGNIMGAISINNTLNYIVQGNLIKRTRDKDACGINVQNYTSGYFQKNKRGIIKDNIISDTANQGIKVFNSEFCNVDGNVITNVSLSNLVTGYSKVMAYIQDITGNVNNNIFKQHTFSDGDCTIIGNNQVQMPIGLIEDSSVYLNAPITLYISDTSNTQIKVETTISSIDISTCIATVQTDLSSLRSVSDKVKYYLVGNYQDVSYILRFYQNNKINLIGNYIEKNVAENVYRNDLPETNVITQLTNILSYNTIVTI